MQQEGEFFDLDKSRSTGWCRCTATCGRASSSSTSRRSPSSRCGSSSGPMVTGPRGLSVRPDDRHSVLLPVGGQGELEALHGRVPGVLPRAGGACEPVADGVFGRCATGRFRGAALPDRRSAPTGEHVGDSGVGDGRRDASSRWRTFVRAACSGRGTSPISARCRPDSTRPSATRGGWTRSSCSRTSSSSSGVRAGISPITTGRRRTTATSSRATVLPATAQPAGAHRSGDWQRCRSRSTRCRTPTPSRPPRRWSSHARSRSSCSTTKRC